MRRSHGEPAGDEAERPEDRRNTVFFGFPDLKRALRATADGRTTNRKVHAAILTRAEVGAGHELSRPYLD